MTRQEPPAVRDREWPRNWLDRFILARLEAEGLRPAPPADRRTLIRRLTFNLVGLPPEPGEVEAFVNDPSLHAYSNLVERLLDSPHYGERWARHWLDVVRYADTTAHDGNYIMRYAYRYRDYVVRAFNQDKPYDRFILEQLAGDLLSGDADWWAFRDRMVATGFLVLGPKALAEQDKEKFILDVVDEQIDVTGRTFLGLTLACSRCHDHKFDPIPTADYYSLAAIFKGTRTMADLEFASKWQEWPLVSELRKRYPDRFPAPVPSLAGLGEARQSTTKCEATADKAIDGVFNNRQETDDGDSSPWWEVKLAESGPIGMVVLWNRVDAEFKRLSNFRVSVLNGERREVWSRAFFPEGPDAEEFSDPGGGIPHLPTPGNRGPDRAAGIAGAPGRGDLLPAYGRSGSVCRRGLLQSASGPADGDGCQGRISGSHADPGPRKPPQPGEAGPPSFSADPGSGPGFGRQQRTERPPGAGPVHCTPRQPLDGAGDGQPDLAVAFRQGPGGQQRQLREPGGQAVPSRAAGSIGRPFHGFGMVRQAVAPADPALQPLPDAERRLQPGG